MVLILLGFIKNTVFSILCLLKKISFELVSFECVYDFEVPSLEALPFASSVVISCCGGCGGVGDHVRAKHLGTLSQSARSFFLSGTRCSAADGSSCTCSEDETLGVGSLTLVDSEKVNAKKPENSSLSQEITTSRSLDRAVSVSYADDFDAKDIAHPSPPIADQFVKAGMAAVGLLSDLVNYRIPMTDGSAMVTSLQNSMVDPTKPISNVRSANMKTSRKDKVYDKPSAEPVSRSSSTSISCGEKGRANKSVSAKGVGNVSSNVSGDFVENHGITSESRDGKRPVPQRSRAYSDRFIPNTQQSEGKLNGNKSAGFTRDIRHTKVIGGAAPVARQFLSSSHVESALVFCISPNGALLQKRLLGSSTAYWMPSKQTKFLSSFKTIQWLLGFSTG
ncbi:Pentatricopeptide repeat-containing protein [Sesamum angolense]|uniref:Pentatricopeptide repeat-containing protein n=1 Tax=Sesamum angolense TaxID=2727404 RepID=A0AAE1TBE6_9LAMI|nr:Pentatricopeptide repeat-containing protein [Sesamum angolense]